MKKFLLLSIPFILIGIVILSGFIKLEEHFYYAYEEKIPLEKMEHKIVIGYKEEMDKSAIRSLINATSKEVVSLEFVNEHTVVVEITTADNLKAITDKAKESQDVKFIHPVFNYQKGLEMALTDEIVIKFKNNISNTVIDSLNAQHGLELIKKTRLHNLYRVTDGNPLQIANLYQELGLVVFSHPNFISKITLHQQPVPQSIPNDPYFTNQFYLNNTGQTFNGHTGNTDADIDAAEAWTITEGDNDIIVAVLDQGVTANHVDLPNTRQIRLNGSNFSSTGNANDPSPDGNGNHGNAAAGVIAATRNNNIGIAGIAPNVRILPIKIVNGDDIFASTNNVALAITFAVDNGADVISNSWSYDSTNPNLYPVIVDAIQDAVTTGRNNLGCVVAFSAGNTAAHASSDNGYVRFPANVSISGVLTVGATDRYDLQADYSPTSSLIDICAPSHRAYPNSIAGETAEVWTTDIPGNAGYNPWPGIITPPATGEILPNTGTNHLDFTGRFGGTSASCSQVAGVAALVLSANPGLTQQQVYNFITSSADKVGGVSYPGGRNNQYGYGRLNAYKAVYAAIPKLNVTINGPGYLSYCDQGNWSSSISNGNGNYTYKWYVTETGYGTVPPVTTLEGTGSTYTTYMDYHTNPPNTNSFNLNLYVTDSNGRFGRGFKAV